MTNSRWVGRLVLKISLTDQPIDYIWNYTKHNLENSKAMVSHDSWKCQRDLKVVRMWNLGLSSTKQDQTK